MQRRKFLQDSLMAGGGIFAASNIGSQPQIFKKLETGKVFNLNYAFHDGMFKNSAGPNFIDQIKFAYDMGFRAIEDNGMMSRPVDEQKKIGDTLAKLGMQMGGLLYMVMQIAEWSREASILLMINPLSLK